MLISLAKFVSRCRQPLRRFLGDTHGAPAVEFALVAPVMILFYLGCSEICQAVIAKRKVIQAADSMADLVARSEEVSAGDVSAIRAISDDILYPLPWTLGSGNAVCVQYYRKNSGGTVYLDWQDGCSGVTTTTPATTLFPSTESSLVRVTMTYHYTSAATSVFMPNGLNFTTTAFYAPRDSEYVTYN